MDEKFLKSRFQGDLAFVENTENYYAMFQYVIEKCATAQVENLLLYTAGILPDEKYIENITRIQSAKELAIKTHGEWTIKMFEQSKTQHTPRTLVSSVYADIFNIELKQTGGERGTT